MGWGRNKQEGRRRGAGEGWLNNQTTYKGNSSSKTWEEDPWDTIISATCLTGPFSWHFCCFWCCWVLQQNSETLQIWKCFWGPREGLCSQKKLIINYKLFIRPREIPVSRKQGVSTVSAAICQTCQASSEVIAISPQGKLGIRCCSGAKMEYL